MEPSGTIASEDLDPPDERLLLDIDITTEIWKELIPDAAGLCRNACETALDAAGLFKAKPGVLFEVSILLADDRRVQQLNKDFRDKDKPTNVLAFPSHKIIPTAFGSINTEGAPSVTLGDIVLSAETVSKEAKEQSKDIAAHVQHLVVHATLHLLGFDHKTEDAAALMEPLEVEVLEKLGVENPYVGKDYMQGVR